MKQPRKHTAFRWIMVALCAVFIFFMSSRSSGQLSEDFFGQVKILLATCLNAVFGYHEDPVSPFCHFCEYALFGALWAHALRNHMSLVPACIGAVICASCYGITDEIHQLFVPGRACDPVDWLVDTCGASLGSLCLFVGVRMKGRRER